MRVWLDDMRPMPSHFDRWAKTGEEAIEILNLGGVTHISLDHDLGYGLTGYDVASAIARGAYESSMPPLTWACHSANPVGRARIVQAMTEAERFWSKGD